MTKSEALKIANHINKLIYKSNKTASLRFSMRNGKPEISFIYVVEFGRAKHIKISKWFTEELVEEAIKEIERILKEEASFDE
ncbi:hypothetical protein GZH82_05500 [Staphylococcus ursi]|uniref:hypothetical protein n=1 Tax=Staphylococcus sp. MI 10-1553 TaxID=1912064 RepID=UPI001397B3C4|nr:hypothetical protein [Staphylococcus sp. MI 10-1553]QHW36820.1 hypothetical protein GZH82_05500 [Staphylococcus sp. MI 10-1553]